MILFRFLFLAGWSALQFGLAFLDVQTNTKILAIVRQDDCNAVLEQVTQEPDWIDRLLDPQISSPQELQQRLELYTQVHTCLMEEGGQSGAVLAADQRVMLQLSEYFLIFVGGYGSPEGFSALQIVDLAQSDNPAVIALREEAGLPPPEGYVFLRFYRSRAAMPPLVRTVFDQDTAGVTMFTRYIAIPEENPSSWEANLLHSVVLPTTTSHELVHAYVNASVGLAELKTLPDWFSEGVAIYLSGSGEDHTVVGPDQTITSTSPQDYRQYRNNFKYLENKIGRARLLELIRLSIQQAEPSLVYRDLNYEDDQAFLAGAAAYWQRRLYLVGGGIVLVLSLIVWQVLRMMPEVRCENCDHTGKRADFKDGYCPECYYPYRE